MDIAIESGIFTPKELASLNACRLYYDVLTVADICQANGEYLVDDIDWGENELHSTSNLRRQAGVTRDLVLDVLATSAQTDS